MTHDESAGYRVIGGHQKNHPYLEKVASAYEDSPEDWRKVLGDLLHFQWGVYDHPDSPRPVSLDEAGTRHLERQLQLAGLTAPDRPRMRRVLDLGCGWGATLHQLARAFPECDCLEGVNISRQQLEYSADFVTRHGEKRRVPLYLCDAAEISRLPDPERLYDLVVLRGAITHFPYQLYEVTMAALSARMREGGLLVVSETLYSEEFIAAEPAVPQEDDHLAIGYRKTPEYFAKVLSQSGFAVRDMRVLPSYSDAAHWLLELKSNIETRFPHGTPPPLAAIRDVSVPLSIALLEERVGAYSVIAERRGHGPLP
ncbi:SAM-dependent methyltransferase [Streptomyces iconiensis]|uniref:Class I SAM-dependent methyltransferase n=1 Tax=Streptomyces iconiensis TaxID=1384038 RepID=A0ABT7A3L3_9ACTN|nr:class I SAM-dependent methyltransferase [Streptomyces iconiensis]MDJ1135654.1 class I SAM-dependent methyltransferase [Streptomyces iconiensis]